jgi:hypothetical protein
VCISCKENKYFIGTGSTCTGDAVGNLKGCLRGTATKCEICNPFFDYVMYLPGMCAKKSEITEEFLMKARETAAFSQIISTITGLLIFLGLQL